MDAEIESLLHRLARLRRADPALQVYGALEHRHRLAPPLAPAMLARIEARYGVRLPEPYRRFVTTAGNGGAGPELGLVAFAFVDDARGEVLPRPEDDTAPFLYDGAVRRALSGPQGPSLPFPLTGPSEAEGIDLGHGTWDLGDLGCATRSLLVLDGPFAGEVWIDDRANECGVMPFRDWARDFVGGPLPSDSGFLAWYGDWLDRALEEARPGGAPRLPPWAAPDPLADLRRRREERAAAARAAAERAERHAAREARRDGQRGDLRERSAATIARHALRKDGARVPGICPACERETQLRFDAAERVVLCMPCYFAF